MSMFDEWLTFNNEPKQDIIDKRDQLFKFNECIKKNQYLLHTDS
jgi:hypothetical protein